MVWSLTAIKITTLSLILNNTINFSLYEKLIYEFIKQNISFVDMNVKLSDSKLSTDFFITFIDRHQVY